MPLVTTPADQDPCLAIALGRFSQACVYLERRIEESLYRLLPVTDPMGHILFAGNQMRRNIEILRALTLLPEVPLTNDQRTKIQGFCTVAIGINDDRSRLLHNPIVGDPSGHAGDPGGYFVVQHKSDGKGSGAMPITEEFILERVRAAQKLAWNLTLIPRLNYDLSKWEAAFPAYPLKEYPKAQKQANEPRLARTRKPRRK